MFKTKNRVIITFDYELFLGSDSGDLYKSLIEPTKKILSILRNTNSYAIFFVDAPFLLFLKNNDEECFFCVKNQLIDIVTQGSYLGLHIHAQWKDAYPIGTSRWSFSGFENYRFHALDIEEQSTLFYESLLLLNTIVQEANSLQYCSQKIVNSFRAGGWSIQPFASFRHLFLDNGINYDFSVRPKAKIEQLPFNYYNFENISIKPSFWRFSIDPCEAVANGDFNEYPVSVITIRGYLYILRKLLIMIFNTDFVWFGDGKGLSQSVDLTGDIVRSNIFKKFLRLFQSYNVPLYFENNPLGFFKIMISNRFKVSSIALLVGHPKTFSNSALDNLEYTARKYDSYIPF